MKAYKKWPELHTDEEAEEFVANSDLTEYDWSDFKRVHFEFEPHTDRVCLEIPPKLLATIKSKARAQNISWEQYILLTLEQSLS